ncbi:MAG: CoA transferase [Actinobacteria bacterium]|nr:CoA transferase [Actinomycetota bacterium]
MEALLAGIRVVDAGGEPVSLAGRILADLGAEVGPATPRALARADVVIETPGWPGCPVLDPADAPDAVWVRVTPFGLDGPRSGWRASDLGIMAASGNMHATGDPDRPPVRPSEPAAYAHVGPEVAFAALSGLARGGPAMIDVSMQEVVLAANMCAPARLARTGEHVRRRGANIGRTREIWACRDGWVSFGLRGGKARAASLETVTRLCIEAGIAPPEMAAIDWTAWSHTEAPDDELKAIEDAVARLFALRTMAEWYEVACETNLMLAPINSPKEIYGSAQLAARHFFDPSTGRPRTFVHARAPVLDGGFRRMDGIHRQERGGNDGAGPWAGTKILEFGSGAAGPIATRYFVEHGATVIRVESKTRPDFLRTYALGPGNPFGLEGSVMLDGLNVGKLSVTLNLKHPRGVALAGRLVHWADAVVENFAPKAMRGFGLGYDTLAAGRPDLVMVSSCLNGQTGPHKDYPGFGGQGAALSGWNFVTGWPEREPVGPFGTITDSLAPRFVATALAAGLLYRRATGEGVYLDVSQVECGVYALTDWLLHYRKTGEARGRNGNGHPRALVHGVFPCRGDDRWVAVACWTDEDRDALARVVGGADPDALGAWTSTQDREEVAETLQALGIEAIPVQGFEDLLADPQLAHRGHFVTLDHPVMGPGPYERNGFRVADAPGGYASPGPTLGQHTREVLAGILGLTDQEVDALEADGALD